MALTDTGIKALKAGQKPRKHFDAASLFLLVTPNGGKWWRFKYRFGGKEKLISFGTYPEVPLKDARNKRDQARRDIAADIDPGIKRKAEKDSKSVQAANSFEVIAREWFTKHESSWVASHSSKIIRRLERDVFPWLGSRPISEVTAAELLSVLRRVEGRNALDTAHRTLQNCSQVFRYAVATLRAKRDPTTDLRGALPPVKQSHHPSITEPKAIGELLRAIDGYSGSFITQCALKLAPLTFVRPGELRKAEWAEFDLDGTEWRIPAERMKMRELHIVALSIQAIQVLRELHALTGTGKYVFPGARTNGRPMSENTVNAALRRLGYTSDEMTGHGFRSMASTRLNEQGWNRDVVERQLAHAERDDVRAAYNYAEHLSERRKMMQHWAEYLDTLRNGTANVIPINAKGKQAA